VSESLFAAPSGFWSDCHEDGSNGTVSLTTGDCRGVLPGIKNVDVVVTDPPYGQTSLAWDVPVDDWLPLVDACLKPHGSLWIFGSLRSLAPLVAAADRGDLGPWRFAQDIVWEKHNGSSFHADRFRRVHEQAAHFYRGAWGAVYKAVQTTPDATKHTMRRKGRPPHMGEIGDGNYASDDGGPRLMRSVLQVRSMHGTAIHPTQKPEGIVRPLIAYSCPPGGVVLDPFAGSGTTLAAARSLGCIGMGIEKDASYVQAAIERLSQTTLEVVA